MKFALKRDNIATEAFTAKIQEMQFPIIAEMASLIKKAYPDAKKGVIDLYEHSCSKITWCPFIIEGFLKKEYVFAEKMEGLNADQFIGLVQLLYIMHASYPERWINVVSIEIDLNKPSNFEIFVAYNKKIDSAQSITNGLVRNKVEFVKKMMNTNEDRNVQFQSVKI